VVSLYQSTVGVGWRLLSRRHDKAQAIYEPTTFRSTMLAFSEKSRNLISLKLDVSRRFRQQSIVRCRKKVRVAGWPRDVGKDDPGIRTFLISSPLPMASFIQLFVLSKVHCSRPLAYNIISDPTKPHSPFRSQQSNFRASGLDKLAFLEETLRW